jgi:hypothetical protein
MVEQSVSYAAERFHQRCNQYNKEHFGNSIYNLFNKEVSMLVILWLGGFLLGIGIGGYFGKMKERKDWDDLIRDGKLPKPGQRWKPDDWKNSKG